MNKIIFLFLIFFSSIANASQAFASEFSHFSGGLIMTLLAAYVMVRFMKTHRNKAILWAFWFSTIFVSISQTRDYLSSGKIYGQVLDFFWHTVGTLLAVLVLHKLMKSTDKGDTSATVKQGGQAE
ncbi:MAG TPA: hypothetical protein PLL19_07640 [Thiobacillaceae bacterium]|nr:hypothetical protein [Thiobacillaceae bacterium]HNH89650.1 hypothetical protein [Thiobacillaceae bacterium]